MELNTTLMGATFKIEGDNKIGTVFILGRPTSTDPSQGNYILVTAAHVLEDIDDDKAIIHIRAKDNNGNWQRFPFPLLIRANGRELWVKHPEADVAAMYINMLQGSVTSLLSVEMLATDDILEQFEVHPGDKLFCLGYPLGAESNDLGFPILRSGWIASYPIMPTKQVKTFLFDFEVFPGNSGGPVYFIDSMRAYGGATRPGVIQFIIGLVSNQSLIAQEVTELYAKREQKYPLALAEVIHASIIRETIDMLPTL